MSQIGEGPEYYTGHGRVLAGDSTGFCAGYAFQRSQPMKFGDGSRVSVVHARELVKALSTTGRGVICISY